jgi:acetyl-CoA C-acetyltransferase
LGAGIRQDVGCATVNKMCGSGMKAAMQAHDREIRVTNLQATIEQSQARVANRPNR